jgi:hypothetical protein
MDLSAKRDDLLFGVRRSTRYHSRRRMFFERYNLFTNALSLIFGSAAIFAVLNQAGGWAIFAGALVTIASAINLVVGSTRMARVHEELARRFVELEKCLVLAGDYDEKKCAEFIAARLDIESTEPTPLRVLDAICHNELMRAMGHADDHPDMAVVGAAALRAGFRLEAPQAGEAPRSQSQTPHLRSIDRSALARIVRSRSAWLSL